MPWRHCIMPPTVKGKYERNQMVVGGGAPHIAPLTKIVNFLFFCFRWTDQLNFLSNRRECDWSDTTIANETRGVVCGEGDDSESPVKILLGMSSTICSPSYALHSFPETWSRFNKEQQLMECATLSRPTLSRQQ